MQGFMEDRFYGRFIHFTDTLNKLKIDMRFNQEIDLSSCKLTEQSSSGSIRNAIEEMYAAAEVSCDLVGGQAVYGVSIDRSKNFEFENYEFQQKEGELRFKFNERIMPE